MEEVFELTTKENAEIKRLKDLLETDHRQLEEVKHPHYSEIHTNKIGVREYHRET
jgi:hypothetical protein